MKHEPLLPSGSFIGQASPRGEAIKLLESLEEIRAITRACSGHFVHIRDISPAYEFSLKANRATESYIHGTAHQQPFEPFHLRHLLDDLHTALNDAPTVIDAKITDLSYPLTHDNVVELDASKAMSEEMATKLALAMNKAESIGLFGKLATFDPRAAMPAATAPKAQPARSR